ncbi:MAG: trimethylamine methyltransferase family protein, partial [Thermoleophilia bacterium]
SAQWRPTILNRKSHERWQDDGAPDLREAARRRALELLRTHVAAPLDAGLKGRIDALVDGFAPRGRDRG